MEEGSRGRETRERVRERERERLLKLKYVELSIHKES